MKSRYASERAFRHNLIDNAVSLILLSEDPAETIAQANYTGNQPTPITNWTISGHRAENATPITLPLNTGTTTVRIIGWALVDNKNAWIYANKFNRPFEVRPNDEPYLDTGDVVIDD
jgi:hypothetical protein